MIANPHPDGTIILVDDDHEDAHLLRRALDHVRFRAHFIHLPDGDGFLHFLSAHALPQRSLVLLDLHLGHRLSFEILHQLKEQTRLAETPVIMYTCDPSPDYIKIAAAAGADAYIEKPDTLTSSIDFLELLSSRWLDPNSRIHQNAKHPRPT